MCSVVDSGVRVPSMRAAIFCLCQTLTLIPVPHCPTHAVVSDIMGINAKTLVDIYVSVVDNDCYDANTRELMVEIPQYLRHKLFKQDIDRAFLNRSTYTPRASSAQDLSIWKKPALVNDVVLNWWLMFGGDQPGSRTFADQAVHDGILRFLGRYTMTNKFEADATGAFGKPHVTYMIFLCTEAPNRPQLIAYAILCQYCW